MGRTKKTPEAIHSLGCCISDHLENMNSFLEIISNNLSQGNVFNVSIQYVCDDPDDTTTCHWVLVVEYNDHTTQQYDIPCTCGDSVVSVVYINDPNSLNYGHLIVTHSDGSEEDYYIGVITNIEQDTSNPYVLTVTYADGSTSHLHLVTDISFNTDGNMVVAYSDGTTQTYPVGHLDEASVYFFNVNDPQTPTDGGGTLSLFTDQGQETRVYFGQITSVTYLGGEFTVCRVLDENDSVILNNTPGYEPGDIYCETIELDVVDAISCVDDNGTKKLRIHFTDGHTQYLDVCGDCGCGGGDSCTNTPVLDSSWNNETDELTITYDDCAGNNSTTTVNIPVGNSTETVFTIIDTTDNDNSSTSIISVDSANNKIVVDISNTDDLAYETAVGYAKNPDGATLEIRRIWFDFVATNSGVLTTSGDTLSFSVFADNTTDTDMTIEILKDTSLNGGNGKIAIVGFKLIAVPVDKNGSSVSDYIYEISSSGHVGHNDLTNMCATYVYIDTNTVVGTVNIKLIGDKSKLMFSTSASLNGGFGVLNGYVDYVVQV